MFSDIHGNNEALRSGLQIMAALKPDQYVFLGDLCGYYPFVEDCFDQLQKLAPLISLRGNHDDYFLRIRAGDRDLETVYATKYGAMFTRFVGQRAASGEIFAWLESLESSGCVRSEGCLFAHGTVMDTLEGRYYPSDTLNKLNTNCLAEGVRYVFMGHTHYVVDVEVDGVRFINPGSVGQPRQGCPPSFFFLDTISGEGYHVYFMYDRNQFADSIRSESGLTKYSREVIWRY